METKKDKIRDSILIMQKMIMNDWMTKKYHDNKMQEFRYDMVQNIHQITIILMEILDEIK